MEAGEGRCEGNKDRQAEANNHHHPAPEGRRVTLVDPTEPGKKLLVQEDEPNGKTQREGSDEDFQKVVQGLRLRARTFPRETGRFNNQTGTIHV